MPSTLFTSLPNSMAFAVHVARKLNNVPDSVTDDAAIEAGLIDPATIALILQIVQEVMKCMNNNKAQAFARIRNHITAKPFEKIADQMRMNSFINSWMGSLAIPREAGDVVMLREAIATTAGDLDETKLGQIQTEMLWMTI